jgi:hypothetical protein
MAVYTLNSRGGGSNQGTLTQMLRQSASQRTLSQIINPPGASPQQIITPPPIVTGPTTHRIFNATTALQPASLACVRSGATGTYWDSSGVLQTASANTVRFDNSYNGSTWAANGMLVEGSFTNDSPTDLTAYNNFNMVITGGASDPHGGTSAYTLQPSTGGSGNHLIYIANTNPGNRTTPFSALVKPNGYGQFILRSGTTAGSGAVFNLTGSGSVAGTYNANAGADSVANAAIVQLGAWYLVSANFTYTSGTNNFSPAYIVLPSSTWTAGDGDPWDNGNHNYNGDGSSIIIYNPQYEASTAQTKISSEVLGATTSRSADSISFTMGGATELLFTFDDLSTQTVSGLTPYSVYTIPTTLNRSHILYIDDNALFASANLNLAADSGTFNITGNAAGMAVQEPAASGTFAITGNAASFGVNLPALSGAFSITGFAVGPAVGEPASSGSFAINGFAAGLKVNLPAASGTFTYTGNAATLIHIAKLAAGSGTFLITGNSAGMAVGLPALSGTFNYTGNAAAYAVGEPAGSGSFAITGRAATLIVKMPAGSGAFNITGNAAADAVGEPAGSGSFAITGRAAGYNVQMGLGSGSFAITGHDATLTATHSGISLDAGSGSFAINGRPAAMDVAVRVDSGVFSISSGVLSFQINEPLGSGAFAITGHDAAFTHTSTSHVLNAGSGSFLITGGDTTWQRFRRKYGTWVQPPVAPPVQVAYETLIRRNDATFRRDGQRLPEYEFTQHTFVADPATRGPYEAP